MIFFLYLINCNFIYIFIKNNLNYEIRILRKFKLKNIIKLDYKIYF